jgi:hydrogenase small subunit
MLKCFVKACVAASAMMGLPFRRQIKVAQAVEKNRNPSVIWLHFQDCTGLRSTHPTIFRLILGMIALDYHETLMAGSGARTEKTRHDSMTADKGKHILIVEGAIPTKQNGIFCKVSGKTALEPLQHTAEGRRPSSVSGPLLRTAGSTLIGSVSRHPDHTAVYTYGVVW